MTGDAKIYVDPFDYRTTVPEAVKVYPTNGNTNELDNMFRQCVNAHPEVSLLDYDISRGSGFPPIEMQNEMKLFKEIDYLEIRVTVPMQINPAGFNSASRTLYGFIDSILPHSLS